MLSNAVGCSLCRESKNLGEKYVNWLFLCIL
jgi:hypothetical protein